ncbi:MAG: transporter ATP-binding protein [Clostridia bacterium]|jgi:ATP-binding cassette subfamily B protein|nr:transporter ATP-binding protein [Clostridia bacterium]
MTVNQEQDYTKRFDFGLWRKLLRYAAPYKKLMLALGFVMICAAGIDVIFPLMTKYAIDNFAVSHTLEGLKGFAMGYFALVIIQAANAYVLISIAGKIEMGMCYDIRRIGFKRLQELSFSYYDKTAVGWIMARMTSDIARLSETIAWGLVDFVWGAMMMIGIAIVMLIINWKLALLCLAVMPVVAFLSMYFQQKILKAYRVVRKTNSKITGAFNEGISGAKTTKTLVREEKNLEEFKTLTKEMYSSSVQAAIFSSVYLPLVLALGSIGTALVLWRGGQGVMLTALSFGTLVLFVQYSIQFFEPVRELARIFAELQSAQASAERVLSMIDTEPDIVDSKEVLEKYGEVFNSNRELWPDIAGNITFRNVSFSYKDGEKVLENFSLDVKAGETIALVGETGSGKSTIVNLACRFYEPTEGEILVDGVDYRTLPIAWLQSNLGYVLQTPHLFSGTIRENIRYAKLDARDEDIVNAARLVNAHDFISKLEKGYDSEVGEGGSRLSTGEKQLISFARAILANPRIFVLDEATSSIDTETEHMIQEAIQKVLENRTSFIVAHRLSTIRSADRILVIRDGKVLEQGSHKQLMKQKGYYYNLYTNQFIDEQELGALNA